MFRRLMLLTAALTVVACAGQKAEGKKTKATESKQRLANVVPFDLAGCFPREHILPKPANEAVLTALWVSAQPRVTECLVDPKHRGAEKLTTLTVKSTLDETGLKRDVSGTNLSAEGQKCIETVLASTGRVDALPKGHKPVVLQNKLEHQVGRDPAVEMKVNEISDVAATVRLASPQWCECYAAWKDAPPHVQTAKLTLHKAGDKTAAVIEVAPTNDAVADPVGTCVKGKLAALALPVTSDTLSIPGLPLLYINTSLDHDLSADQPGSIRIAQLDGLRAQRNADSALRAGAAANSAQTYAAAVTKYKANPKSVTVKELKDKCEGLLKSDDDYLKSLGAQVDIDQRTLALATSLKATDASWTELEVEAQKQVVTSQAQVVEAKKIRQKDSDACPKVKL